MTRRYLRQEKIGLLKGTWVKATLCMACIAPLLTGCGGGEDEDAAAMAQLAISTPFALSDFGSGDKPKIQRASDGTLVVV